jgi:hypothetical protein
MIRAAGREGIEPSLRVLEARPVTMTLRPKNSATRIEEEVIAPNSGHASIERRRLGLNRCTPPLHSPRATRRGIEPLSLHRQWSCDASRITGQRGDGRESNPPPQGHGLPSSQTSTVTVGRRGVAPRSLGLQPSAITRLAHDPRPAVVTDHISAPGGSRRRDGEADAPRFMAESHEATHHRPLERRASLPLDDRGLRALVRNRTGASRLRGGRSTIELQGHAQAKRVRAPAEGIEPSKDRLTAGCLTIRLRWNETGSRGQPAPRCWRRDVKERCPGEEGRRIHSPERRAVRAVPGAGIVAEPTKSVRPVDAAKPLQPPALLESEASVLTIGRPRIET